MSLYEMHYVTSTSEQARLKEQQQKMRKALEELSISTKLQQEQENDRFITKNRLDRWYPYLQVSAECRPYTPYLPEPDCESMMTSTRSSSSSAGTSILTRKLSMSSVSSSFVSYLDKSIEIDERDQYGFKRPIEWVEPKQLQAFDIKYKSILQKQTKSWNKLFKNSDQQWPTLCSQLSRYVRYGVPQEIRAKAWMHYSGANNKMNQNPGLYSTLETNATSPERDRIFLDHPLFTGESNKISVLRRILNAFHLYCPEIEYCQSLHFLAGFLLIMLEQEEEEHVFWLLVTTVQDYLPKDLFTKTGSDLEQTVFMMMVYEKMPGVWSKVANKKCFWECEQTDSLPPITLVTTHWFSTLFINVLPIETMLRVWDCFYIGEGYTVLYKAALTIMKLNEQAIWNTQDSVDTIKILQNMPKRLVDCHEFIKSIFSPHGIAFDLTTEEINRKRDLFLNRKSLRK